MSCNLSTDGQAATDGGFLVVMGHYEARFYDEVPQEECTMEEVISIVRKGLIAMGYHENLVDRYITLEDS